MGITTQLYKSLKPIFKGEIWNFIDLESPVIGDNYTFVTKNHSLLTIIRFDGFTKIAGDEETMDVESKIIKFFRPTFKESGHTIQLTFDYDNEFTERLASESLQGQRITCDRLKMDLDDIIDENINIIKRFCVAEGSFIALWSHLSTLEADTIKEQEKTISKKIDSFFNLFTDMPNPFKYYDRLMTVHASFVNSFINECENAYLSVEKMEVHDAAREIRRQIEKDYCHFNWKPKLLGDEIIRVDNLGNNPAEMAADALYPRLDIQISRSPHEPIENGVFRIGSTYYTTMFVNVFPIEVEPFTLLLNRIGRKNSFRITYTINHGRGLDVAVNSTINMFLKLAHPDNDLIDQALKSGTASDINGEKLELSFQIAVTVMNKDLVALRKSSADLVRSFQGYGNTELMLDTVDPSEIHITNAIGTCYKSAITRGYPPLDEMVRMLPLVRPASFWREGSIVFRTTDGKIWPWQPASKLQESTVDLIFAKPRQGKSVLSNAICTALCMKSGIQRLPWIAILDIGPSSSGFIQLIKDSLPENMKHLAIHHKMAMVPEHAVNFLDLQLGCKHPLPIERQFISNMLSQMVTPPGMTVPKEDMNELISQVIDETYNYYANTQSAKLFSYGVDLKLDELIQANQNLNVVKEDIYGDISWYDVRDELFKAGYVEEAVRAQRYAVPTLNDMVEVALSSNVLSRAYGHESGRKEDLVKDFANKIGAVLRDYCIFTQPTQIDFSNAKLVAIDLQDVRGPKTPAGAKQTGIMYMLGRYVAAKNFYITETYLSSFDPIYQAYQQRRIKEISEDEKRIVYDEFHSTEGCVPVRNQVELDQREGGKWGVQVCLISQNAHDFTDAMVKNATNKFILGGASALEVQQISERFGLTKTEKLILGNNILHGPTEQGSCLLYKFETKKGSFSQVLRFAKGPKEIWAYSTTRADMNIRQFLTDNLGAREARQALAEFFPECTAVPEIETRMKNRKDIVDVSMLEKEQDSIAVQLSKEVLQEYKRKKKAQKAV